MTQPAPYPTTTTVGSALFAVAAAHAEFKRVDKLLASEGVEAGMADAALPLARAFGWLDSANVCAAAGASPYGTERERANERTMAGRRYARAVRSALESLAETVGRHHDTYKAVAHLKGRPRTAYDARVMPTVDLVREYLTRCGASGGTSK